MGRKLHFGDKIFCVYLAANEDIIRKHSQMSGIPATRIYKVDNRIDPTLATSLVGPIPIGHTPYPACRRPPTSPAFGRPDDRLQRTIR
jgi:hypothetical protein